MMTNAISGEFCPGWHNVSQPQLTLRFQLWPGAGHEVTAKSVVMTVSSELMSTFDSDQGSQAPNKSLQGYQHNGQCHRNVAVRLQSRVGVFATDLGDKSAGWPASACALRSDHDHSNGDQGPGRYKCLAEATSDDSEQATH